MHVCLQKSVFWIGKGMTQSHCDNFLKELLFSVSELLVTSIKFFLGNV